MQQITTFEQLIADIPALRGSEKQVKWAEDIRRADLAAAWKFCETAKDLGRIRRADLFLAGNLLGEESDQIDRMMEAISAALAEMAAQDAARWWIDHRGEAVLLIKAAGKAAM